MATRFSERHGYTMPERDIAIREDAPENLRFAIAQIAVECGMQPGAIREVVCRSLLVQPDRNNWSDYPNIWGEVQDHLQQCPWFKIYDIAEALYQQLRSYSESAAKFKSELNQFLRSNGIGWQLSEDGIWFRGDEAFSVATTEAAEILTETRTSCRLLEINDGKIYG